MQFTNQWTRHCHRYTVGTDETRIAAAVFTAHGGGFAGDFLGCCEKQEIRGQLRGLGGKVDGDFYLCSGDPAYVIEYPGYRERGRKANVDERFGTCRNSVRRPIRRSCNSNGKRRMPMIRHRGHGAEMLPQFREPVHEPLQGIVRQPRARGIPGPARRPQVTMECPFFLNNYLIRRAAVGNQANTAPDADIIEQVANTGVAAGFLIGRDDQAQRTPRKPRVHGSKQLQNDGQSPRVRVDSVDLMGQTLGLAGIAVKDRQQVCKVNDIGLPEDWKLGTRRLDFRCHRLVKIAFRACNL